MAAVSVEEALRVLRDAVKTAKGRSAVDVLSGELGVETNTPKGGPFRDSRGDSVMPGAKTDSAGDRITGNTDSRGDKIPAEASAAGGRFAAAKDKARQSAGASAKGDHSLPPFLRRKKAKGSATAQKGSY